MATTVINMLDAPRGWQRDPQFVYIGRPNPRHGLPRSVFANPIKLAGCNHDRKECLQQYTAWLFQHPDVIRQALAQLPGKTLVCWCKPELCHGDVLVALIEPQRTDTKHFVTWAIFEKPADYPQYDP